MTRRRRSRKGSPNLRASYRRSVPTRPADWTSCWAHWLQTPSDTAALLMMRAKVAMDAQQTDVALKLLDALVKLRPDWVEVWNRRATLYYLQNDYGRSLQDIQQVLIREPRHFGAL